MEYLNLGGKTSIRLATLDAVYFANLFKQRVLADGGIFEAESCLIIQINLSVKCVTHVRNSRDGNIGGMI